MVSYFARLSAIFPHRLSCTGTRTVSGFGQPRKPLGLMIKIRVPSGIWPPF